MDLLTDWLIDWIDEEATWIQWRGTLAISHRFWLNYRIKVSRDIAHLWRPK